MAGCRPLRTSGRGKTQQSYRIRPAEVHDLDSIASLESSIFPDPWSRESFEQSLDDIFLVADSVSGAVGYVISRIAGIEAEILSIGVLASWRKKGVAGGLFAESVRLLEKAGVEDQED